MLRSSLGFHTITLSLSISTNEASQLITDFCTYRKKTGTIEIYRKNEKNEPIIYYHSYYLPLTTNIKFKDKTEALGGAFVNQKSQNPLITLLRQL